MHITSNSFSPNAYSSMRFGSQRGATRHHLPHKKPNTRCRSNHVLVACLYVCLGGPPRRPLTTSQNPWTPSGSVWKYSPSRGTCLHILFPQLPRSTTRIEIVTIYIYLYSGLESYRYRVCIVGC